ncbi:MAG: hypothetical protein HY843_00330 [Bdellovibrio sp.]|nr:hypothetical protein [Bdellovibrio sp.]
MNYKQLHLQLLLLLPILLSSLTCSAFATTPVEFKNFSIKKQINILRTELETTKSNSFEILLQTWSEKYGTLAFFPLIAIAKEKNVPDQKRYIALMGATKLATLLNGKDNIKNFVPFLKDPSWMIRSGALNALKAANESKLGEAVLPMIYDPALVIRVQVIDVLSKLHPTGTLKALISSLEFSENYNKQGKPLWVPEKALLALIDLKPLLTIAGTLSGTISDLERLKKKKNTHPEMREKIQKTINQLTIN